MGSDEQAPPGLSNRVCPAQHPFYLGRNLSHLTVGSQPLISRRMPEEGQTDTVTQVEYQSADRRTETRSAQRLVL